MDLKTPNIKNSAWMIVGLIALLLLVLFAWKRILRFVDTLKARQEAADLKAEINPANLSYTASNYKAFADTIKSAFDGAGTDESTIYNTIKKMHNREDLLQLIIAYGTREISKFPFGTFAGSLPATISEEMTAEEITRINSILSDKGINYQF